MSEAALRVWWNSPELCQSNHGCSYKLVSVIWIAILLNTASRAWSQKPILSRGVSWKRFLLCGAGERLWWGVLCWSGAKAQLCRFGSFSLQSALQAGSKSAGTVCCWERRLWSGFGDGTQPHPELGSCGGLWGNSVAPWNESVLAFSGLLTIGTCGSSQVSHEVSEVTNRRVLKAKLGIRSRHEKILLPENSSKSASFLNN